MSKKRHHKHEEEKGEPQRGLRPTARLATVPCPRPHRPSTGPFAWLLDFASRGYARVPPRIAAAPIVPYTPRGLEGRTAVFEDTAAWRKTWTHEKQTTTMKPGKERERRREEEGWPWSTPTEAAVAHRSYRSTFSSRDTPRAILEYSHVPNPSEDSGEGVVNVYKSRDANPEVEREGGMDHWKKKTHMTTTTKKKHMPVMSLRIELTSRSTTDSRGKASAKGYLVFWWCVGTGGG